MRSMTGCGLGKAEGKGWEVTVDLKTVNHRFFDLSMRLPRNLNFLEQTIREELNKKIIRGHVEAYVVVKNTENGSSRVEINAELAASYKEAGEKLAVILGKGASNLQVERLLTLEGVATVTENEMDQDVVRDLCRQASIMAADQVAEMRAKEGENLREDLTEHLQAVEHIRNLILERAPQIVEEYREKLTARIKNLLQENLDPQRMAQEVALMADRCAIDEELSRLESHIRQMKVFLQAKDEIGKKMDFLIQEMNREANTIGSKASDAQVAQMVVDLKSEIEKLREQIQNVE